MEDIARSARGRFASQLLVIPEEDYQAGMARIEEELRRDPDAALPSQADSLRSLQAVCIVRIAGDKVG